MGISATRIFFVFAAAAVVGIPLVAAQSTQITLYDLGDFQGQVHVMNFAFPGECLNVASYFNDLASSVDTHGNCFTLWSEEDCYGTYHRVRPGSPAHNNLGDERVRFNDITSAVSACQPWES